MTKAYCLKCKKKVDVRDPHQVGNVVKGKCPYCGTKVAVFNSSHIAGSCTSCQMK